MSKCKKECRQAEDRSEDDRWKREAGCVWSSVLMRVCVCDTRA